MVRFLITLDLDWSVLYLIEVLDSNPRNVVLIFVSYPKKSIERSLFTSSSNLPFYNYLSSKELPGDKVDPWEVQIIWFTWTWTKTRVFFQTSNTGHGLKVVNYPSQVKEWSTSSDWGRRTVEPDGTFREGSFAGVVISTTYGGHLNGKRYTRLLVRVSLSHHIYRKRKLTTVQVREDVQIFHPGIINVIGEGTKTV